MKRSHGNLLGAAAKVMTGMPIPLNDSPHLIYTEGNDQLQWRGPFPTDRGTTSGEFICNAYFAHDALMGALAHFKEIYRVLPYESGRYRVALIPSILGLGEPIFSTTAGGEDA